LFGDISSPKKNFLLCALGVSAVKTLFWVRHSDWDGKMLIKPTSALAEGLKPEDLSAYAEDHGLCPWMNA